MRILERDRLVEFQARRGAIVTAPGEMELRDIFKVRAVLYVTMLEQVVRENSTDSRKSSTSACRSLPAAAEESVDAYAVESFLLNFAIVDLCANRLLVDMLQSISLRTLRYARLDYLLPAIHSASLKTWRALRNAAQKRDEKLLLSVAQKRLDEGQGRRAACSR
ncbi:FCD domain-containing protein [Cupriavidus basilensis]